VTPKRGPRVRAARLGYVVVDFGEGAIPFRLTVKDGLLNIRRRYAPSGQSVNLAEIVFAVHRGSLPVATALGDLPLSANLKNSGPPVPQGEL